MTLTKAPITLYQQAKVGLKSLFVQTFQVSLGLIIMLVLTKGKPPGWMVSTVFFLGIGFVAWSESQMQSGLETPIEKKKKKKVVSPVKKIKSKNYDSKNLVKKIKSKNCDLKRLQNAKLSGADLSGAYLRGADLRGADLSKAKLRYANLSDADLSGADLSGAKLVNAKLVNAKLVNADLRGAYVSGANFYNSTVSEDLKKDLMRRGAKFTKFIFKNSSGNRSKTRPKNSFPTIDENQKKLNGRGNQKKLNGGND